METNIRTRGEFEITATDTITGKVRTEKKGNVLTHMANVIMDGTNLNLRKLFISSLPTKSDVGTIIYLPTDFKGVIVANTFLNSGQYLDNVVKDFFVENVWRFNSTGSTNNINTVLLSSDSSLTVDVKVLAYASLNTTFVQGASEVIDIKYRIIAEMPVNYREAFWSYNKYYESLVGALILETVIRASAIIPNTNLNKFVFNIPINSQNNNGSTNKDQLIGTSNTGETLDTYYDKSRAIPKDFIDGVMWRSLGINDEISNSLGKLETAIMSSGNMYSNTPLFDSTNNYPNYPLAPLFNHNKDSNIWCEDVANLATGLGYPVVSMPTPIYSDNWVADMHTINITKSGNAGVARYDHQIRTVPCSSQNDSSTLGYSGEMASCVRHYSPTNPLIPSHTDYTSNDGKPLGSWVLNGMWYNSETFVNVDKKDQVAIGIHNVITNSYTQFDTTTSPALPTGLVDRVSSNNLCRDDAGSIYIGFDTFGIVKITDPLGTAVVTTLLTSVIGGSGILKSITHGFGARIWAMYSTSGLHFSDDGGSSWTNITAWATAGVFDADMVIANTKFLVCNPVNADEMLIVFSDGNTSSVSSFNSLVTNTPGITDSRSAWYNISTNILTGIAITGKNICSTGNIIGKFVFCDPIHGIWMFHGSNVATTLSTGLIPFEVSDDSRTIRNSSSSIANRINIWFYDKLNNLCIVNEKNAFLTSTVMDINGRMSGSFKSKTIGGSDPCSSAIRYDILESRGNRHVMTCASYFTANSNNAMTETLAADYEQSTLYFCNPHSSVTTTGTTIIASLNLVKQPEYSILNDLPVLGSTYRFNTGTTQWVKEYNKPSSESGDGTRTVTAIRNNFATDSNRFNGRCYMDCSESINSTNLTNGLTLLGTFTPETRNINVNAPSYFADTYMHHEEGTHSCFTLYDSVSNKGFTVMWRDYNDNFSLIDATNTGTVVTNVLSASGTEAEFRIAVTINTNGQLVKVYLNGTQVGADITLSNALPMNNVAGGMKLYVGTKYFNYNLMKPVYADLFKGNVLNLQFWHQELVLADITTDNTNHSGLITPSSNLLSRYSMTEDYLEGKLATTAVETLTNNLEIQMLDGDLSADSYTAGDYYNTVASQYGQFRDNVTEYTANFAWYNSSTKIAVATDPNTGTTTIPSTDTTVTQRIIFNTYTNTIADLDDGIKYSGNWGSYRGGDDTGFGCSIQASKGDIAVEWFVGLGQRRYEVSFVKLSDLTTFIETNLGSKYQYTCQFHRSDDSLVDIKGVGATTQSNVSVDCGLESNFRMEYTKVSNTCKLLRHNGTSFVQVGSDMVITNTGEDLCVVFYTDSVTGATTYNTSSSNTACAAMYDINITYTHPAGFLYLGDKTTETGLYKKDFIGLPQKLVNAMTVNVNGTPLIVNVSPQLPVEGNTVSTEGLQGTMGNTVRTAPVAGECFFYRNGLLEFNSIDYGKSVTISEIIGKRHGLQV